MSAWRSRIAVVTGAASGMGRALSAELACRGAHVVMADINADGLASAAADIPGSEIHELDVRDSVAFQALVDDVAGRRGRLDYLFNNAGVGVGGEVQYLTAQHWDRAIDVNIRGVVNGVAAAYPLMVRQGHGTIVNTASMSGLSPVPLIVPYAMTKHAIVGLTRSLRIEARAYGVHVCTLCPGTIDTPMLSATNPDVDAMRPGHWRPNIRRFLTTLTGPAYPPDRFAREALDRVARNEGLIIVPRRARLASRGARLVPWAAERVVERALNAERRLAARPPTGE